MTVADMTERLFVQAKDDPDKALALIDAALLLAKHRGHIGAAENFARSVRAPLSRERSNLTRQPQLRRMP